MTILLQNRPAVQVPTAQARSVTMPDKLKTDIIKRARAVKKIVDPMLPFKRDEITLFDDGTAYVHGMNGNDYTIDDNGQCSCPATRGCRHGDKLTAFVGAMQRVKAAQPKAELRTTLLENDKCAKCGLYPVTLLLWGQYADAPEMMSGGAYRVYTCCGCGDRVSGGAR